MSSFVLASFANQTLISREGDFLDAQTGQPLHTWTDAASGKRKVKMRHESAISPMYASTALARVFLPLPKGMVAPLVAFRDCDPANDQLENLYWISSQDLQKQVVQARYQADIDAFGIPVFDKPEDGFYPNAREVPGMPGYFFIPYFRTAIVVNREGHVFNLRTGKSQKLQTTPKGYLTTTISGLDGLRGFQVHRLIALLFCEKPERHQDLAFDRLEVNHMDLDKKNNKASNLEWMTTQENMKHAWASNAILISKPVVVKDVKSGEILKFASQEECFRKMALKTKINSHLNSASAGRIAHLGRYLFKWDDGKDFPSLYATGSIYGNVKYVIKSEDGKQTILCWDLKHAAEIININYQNAVYHWRTYKHEKPCKGWYFDVFRSES